MPYKHEEHSDESSSRNTEVTRGAKSAVHAKGLRRSKYIIDHFRKIYAKEDENEEKKEEVLNSSHQSTSTTPQLSSTQQSLSQQSDAIDKTGQIKLSDSILVLREEMPDNYSKNKSTDNNDDDEKLPEDETMFNDTSFIIYNKLFD
ncbi:hypothetical protein C1645_840304 [Glomus cerebriforme]|uniref:Uncharacterized protein n=1 Tax=Glomus cerebriforme TaxID=658196 RepID=A0A397S4E9_9GLOM|nr:hypothetical protein C1645_840304 [Glomus cerebriforme]